MINFSAQFYLFYCWSSTSLFIPRGHKSEIRRNILSQEQCVPCRNRPLYRPAEIFFNYTVIWRIFNNAIVPSWSMYVGLDLYVVSALKCRLSIKVTFQRPSRPVAADAGTGKFSPTKLSQVKEGVELSDSLHNAKGIVVYLPPSSVRISEIWSKNHDIFANFVITE